MPFIRRKKLFIGRKVYVIRLIINFFLWLIHLLPLYLYQQRRLNVTLKPIVMKAQFYVYFEDETLIVGMRSEEKFEGADFDGQFYFKYLEGDIFHQCDFRELGFIAEPQSDGVYIYVNHELQDILGYEKDADSVQFEIEIDKKQ